MEHFRARFNNVNFICQLSLADFYFCSQQFFTSKSLTLKIENDDEFKFDRYEGTSINGIKTTASIPNGSTSENDFEYSLQLSTYAWTRLMVPNLGLIIEWYADRSQYANIYINKENKEEIRGYCGSTDNNISHNLELPLTEAVYDSISKVSSPQCDGKDASDYLYFMNMDTDSFDTYNYDIESQYYDFKYCDGSPQYRRRRSTNDEDDPCNGDDPVEICSGILNTLSECKKSLPDNELNSFLRNCQFDMCLDDRNGCTFLT